MTVRSKIPLFFEKTCEVLWALGLIFLPLTSFPLLASLSGGQVAPLSLLPFFFILILWTIPLVFRKGVLPREIIPLLLFFCVTVVSAAAAFFIYIPGFRGRSFPAQDMRALFTLLVGITFFVVTASWVKTHQRLRSTWKYITIGGILAVAWACVQSFYIFRHLDYYPTWMNQIQSWLAVLSPQYSPRFGRVNGLTYEASWFAHQMVMIYLPIWIAATYNRTSAFRFRIFKISLENILMIIGLGVFFMSSPRIGLLSFFLILLYIFIKLNLVLVQKLAFLISRKISKFTTGSTGLQKTVVRVVTSIAIVTVYILVLGGVFYFAVQRDSRLSNLVNQPPSRQEMVGLLTLDQNTLLTLSQRFVFLERMVYWLNGWNVFNQYPWLGVGLGNAGFFFPRFAPAMGWATFEIRSILYYLNQLPNVKSFWFRLLAETGIIGFSVFITWIYMLFQSARASLHATDPVMKTLAMAGLLSLLAFIGEGFSIDSFAMPYLWIMAGLVASIGLIYRSNLNAEMLRDSQEQNPEET